MKFSEETEDRRKANIDYINTRWEQLYGFQVEWAAEGIKYLLFVNAGAAAAVLAFLGSVEAVRDMFWAKLMLGFFVVGVVLVGFVHIIRYGSLIALFTEWRKGVNEYFKDTKDWNDLLNEDNTRAEKTNIALHVAYGSFGCFMIGVLIGLCNF